MSETRNPKRIEPILEKLSAAWKANPDLRLTQLVWNLANSGERAPKFFNAEDTELEWWNVPVLAPEWEGTYRVSVRDIPAEVYDLLSVTYTDEGCLIWWWNRNSWLDGLRPVDMWVDNDGTDRARVLAAVERLEGSGG